jgi:hypothetical protein
LHDAEVGRVSPVKLTPPPAKKGRPSIDWQRCIICQVFTAARLCIPTTKALVTLFDQSYCFKQLIHKKLSNKYINVAS